MSDFQGRIREIEVTIASSGTVSTSAKIVGMRLVGIVIPSQFTGTTMTFQVSQDDVTYTDLYNTCGTIVNITVAASRHIAVDPTDFASCDFIKVVSGSSELAERTIKLIARAI